MKNNLSLLTIALAILLAFPFVSFSQDVEFKSKNFKDQKKELKRAIKDIQAGDKHFLAEPAPFFEKALVEYEKAQEFNPNNSYLNFKIGMCHFYTYKAPESLEFFKKAYELNEFVDPDIDYFLGVGYQYNMEWDLATKHLKEFKRVLDPMYDKEDIAEVNKRMEECKNGKILLKNPVENVRIKNMGENLNSKYSDYGMIVTQDSSTLYFTSKRSNSIDGKLDPTDNQYYEDIYMSTYSNGKWSEAKNAGKNLNLPGHNGVVTFSPDGEKMIIFIDEDGIGNLYECTKNGNNWSKPRKVAGEINTDFHETSAWYSPDGTKLYFVSERPGRSTRAAKNKDIFVATLNPGGKTWGRAKALPSSVNSDQDEDGVYMHPDGKTLYFSSKGHNSMGGYDIFKSVLQEDGKWSKAENLGYPINSPGDDAFFYMGENYEFAYMSSYRKGGYGEKDLYKVIFGEEEEEVIEEPVVEEVVIDEPEEVAEVEPEPEVIIEETPEPEEVAEVVPEPVKPKVKVVPIEEEVVAEVEVPEVKGEYKFLGLVRDAETRSPVQAEVKIINSKNETIEVVNSFQNTGIFKSDLADNNGYRVEVSAPDYVTNTQRITKGQLASKESTDMLFNLQKVGAPSPEYRAAETTYPTAPVKKGKSVEPAYSPSLKAAGEADVIYFDLNSSYLRRDAKLKLNGVISKLNANPSLVIELGAHTDCRESDHYNKWLSDRRAKRTEEYIKQRISNGYQRVSSESFGESQLVNDCNCDIQDTSNCAEESHQANRRVEYVIIGESNLTNR